MARQSQSTPADPATLIGPGIHVRGRVSGEEDLHIEGRLEGSIELTETVYVAPDGIVIDLPQHMGPLAKWCEDRGLTVSFCTARMYKGKAPQPGRDLFAVSTLELG